MEKFTPKLIEKAKTAKSVEELLAIAEENEVLLALDEAKTYFAQLNPRCGELNDDELENVSGAGCDGDKDPDEHWFNPGDRVRVTAGDWKGKTGTSNGMNYTVRGGLATMAWVTFDDNGNRESVNVDYLEHI